MSKNSKVTKPWSHSFKWFYYLHLAVQYDLSSCVRMCAWKSVCLPTRVSLVLCQIHKYWGKELVLRPVDIRVANYTIAKVWITQAFLDSMERTLIPPKGLWLLTAERAVEKWWKNREIISITYWITLLLPPTCLLHNQGQQPLLRLSKRPILLPAAAPEANMVDLQRQES